MITISERRTNFLCLLPSLGRGGAETQVVDLINGLNNSIFDKHLVVFESNLSLARKIDKNINFHHISRSQYGLLTVAIKIAALIDEKKIDVIHCSLQVALLVGWLAKFFSKKKPRLVVTLHTTINRNLKNEIIDKLVYQWLLRSCESIIFVCNNQLEFLSRKYSFIKNKSAVIYNGIDSSYFDPQLFVDSRAVVRRQMGLNETDIVLCNIAGFRPEKGQSILVSAFVEVLVRIPTAVLLFVGGGATKSEIEKKVKELGLEARVKFLGVLDDVRPVLSIATLSVQASTAVETFSIAMLESLSMGVPMVATNIGGTSEAIIQGISGELVESGDVGSLARSIIKIAENRNGENFSSKLCRNLVIERFSKAHMVFCYEKHFFHENTTIKAQ